MHLRWGKSMVWAAVLFALSSRAGLAQDGIIDQRLSERANWHEPSPSQTVLRIHGTVELSNAGTPESFIEIRAKCPTFERSIAIADARGKFSFDLNPNRMTDAMLNGCVLYASLEGYRSSRITLSDLSAAKQKVGPIVLEPISRNTKAFASSLGQQVSETEKKAYKRAFAQATRQDLEGAIATLRRVLTTYPRNSTGWLNLGILQEIWGDWWAAQVSFRTSARLDPGFAAPLIRAAALEAVHGEMHEAVADSQAAIRLNPGAFPDAYAWNATANVALKNIDAAEQSAREGLRLDTGHQFPELEYALGTVLYSRGQRRESAEQLEGYLAHSPNGPNASAAQRELEQMRATVAALKQFTARDVARDDQTSKAVRDRGTEPSQDVLRDQNAALLARVPDHTCLESVSRTVMDIHGHVHTFPTVHVDVAVSGGAEVYGPADSKGFSNNQLNVLGNSFTTTGLFNSIADGIITGHHLVIEPAGRSVVDGGSMFRYAFRTLRADKDWSITYEKESGRAGEVGTFLVDDTSLILRSISVEAAGLPVQLKLAKLSASIDYAPQTIAGKRVLLPNAAVVNVAEQSGVQRVSRMSFNHCRAFTAQSTITFDGVDPANQNTVRSGHLPPGVELKVTLNSPVSIASSKANDLLTATVAESVTWHNRQVVARGAVVEGHVMPRQGTNALMVEFDRVETSDGWAPFYARLVSLRPVGQASIQNAEPDAFDIPGVATVALATRSSELAAGTRMIWKTEPLLVQASPETDVLLHGSKEDR